MSTCPLSAIFEEVSALTDQSSNDVPSPCIDVCRLDKDYAYCIGCFRTINEIKRWSSMTAREKQAVVDAALARRIAC